MHPELSGKRLELLKAAVPRLSRLVVLWNGANPYKTADMREVRTAASALGVTLHTLPVERPQDLPGAFTAARRGHADALITLEDPFTIAHRLKIVELARVHRGRSKRIARRSRGSSTATFGHSSVVSAFDIALL